MRIPYLASCSLWESMSMSEIEPFRYILFKRVIYEWLVNVAEEVEIYIFELLSSFTELNWSVTVDGIFARLAGF